MPRYLGIDWDYDRMHLVAVNINRNKLAIEKAIVLEIPHTLEAEAVSAIGERLKGILKDNKIAPAPLLASLGRERAIFKEVRYPPVERDQEPALVRFQASKEITEPIDRMMIDYYPLTAPTATGERQAIVAIARKPWLRTLDILATSLGVKVVCLTPRPFGLAGCLQLSATQEGEKRGAQELEHGLSGPAPSPGMTVAVLGLSERWAEFTVLRDGNLLFARSLPLGDNLMGEVRRNLALYSSQLQVGTNPDTVKAVYVSGDSQHALIMEQLREVLAIPVYPLDPFSFQEHVDIQGERGGFAAVVGLASLWANEKLPLNLASPKQAVEKVESGPRKYLVLGGGVAALLLIGFLGWQIVLDQKNKHLESLKEEMASTQAQIDNLMPEKKKVDQLQNWEAGAIPWLDELYDLSARFPFEPGFRATRINIEQMVQRTSAKDLDKDKASMRMTIAGVVPRDKGYLVYELMDMINKDKHCRAQIDTIKESSGESGSKSKESVQEFVLRVDVSLWDPEHYVTQLETPRSSQRPLGRGGFRKK